MDTKLTKGDIYGIRWALLECDDITDWYDWDTKKHLVKQELPHLYDAVERLEIARKTILAIADGLDEFDYEEE